jgi:uncharacterized protein
VFADGTSALITRGFLNLTHRGGYDADPVALVPGEWVDVDVELEATAWSLDDGHVLRLAVAGGDWPNVTAPPEPVTLEIDRDACRLSVPVIANLDDLDEPDLAHVVPEKLSSSDGITWAVERDVLARKTRCRTAHGSQWVSAKGYPCREQYTGLVELDTRTFDQRAEAFARFDVEYPEGRTATQSTMTVRTDATQLHLDVHVEAFDDGRLFAEKHWQKSILRDLG